MQPKKIFKAWKPMIQALCSFSKAKAWRLQGSVSSLHGTMGIFISSDSAFAVPRADHTQIPHDSRGNGVLPL